MLKHLHRDSVGGGFNVHHTQHACMPAASMQLYTARHSPYRSLNRSKQQKLTSIGAIQHGHCCSPVPLWYSGAQAHSGSSALLAQPAWAAGKGHCPGWLEACPAAWCSPLDRTLPIWRAHTPATHSQLSTYASSMTAVNCRHMAPRPRHICKHFQALQQDM